MKIRKLEAFEVVIPLDIMTRGCVRFSRESIIKEANDLIKQLRRHIDLPNAPNWREVFSDLEYCSECGKEWSDDGSECTDECKDGQERRKQNGWTP